jgi:hypothetical protein
MGLIPVDQRSIEPHPSDIEAVRGVNGSSRELAFPTSQIVSEIQDLAAAEGFESPLFDVFSGYRSIARQEQLWQRKLAEVGGNVSEARKWVAPPGRSAHHTGHAFDLNLGGPTKSSASNIAHIQAHPAFEFMQRIAPEYGLENYSAEPWHWECDEACRNAYLERLSPEDSAVAASGGSTFAKVGVSLFVLGGALFVGHQIIRKRR